MYMYYHKSFLSVAALGRPAGRVCSQYGHFVYMYMYVYVYIYIYMHVCNTITIDCDSLYVLPLFIYVIRRIRPFVILRIVRPRIFESKFRNHCAKTLDGALRKSTSFV